MSLVQDLSKCQSARLKVQSALSGFASPYTDEKSDCDSALSYLSSFPTSVAVISQARADIQGAKTYLSMSPAQPSPAKTKLESARAKLDQHIAYLEAMIDLNPLG